MTPAASIVNEVLKKLSRLAGFEGDVTTDCFRHFVANEIYEKRESLQTKGGCGF